MTDSLLEYFAELSESQLADIWCAFNCWEWPKDLPIRFKPRWWDESATEPTCTHERKYGFMGPFMDHSHYIVGRANVLKRWRELKCRDLDASDMVQP